MHTLKELDLNPGDEVAFSMGGVYTIGEDYSLIGYSIVIKDYPFWDTVAQWELISRKGE